MPQSYTIQIPAHNSIYIEKFNNNNYINRKLRVDYTVPDEINDETGVLLLIAGYGGNIDSNVYKKMRNLFSENYNLIVLQCSYFGSEFMQTPSVEKLLNMQNDIIVNRNINPQDKTVTKFPQN